YAAARPVTSDSTGLEPKLPAEPVETVLRNVLPEEGVDGVPEEAGMPTVTTASSLGPARPSPEGPAAMGPSALAEPSPSAVTAMALSWRAWLGTIWLSGSAVWLALAGYRVGCFHRLLRLTQRAPPR